MKFSSLFLFSLLLSFCSFAQDKLGEKSELSHFLVVDYLRTEKDYAIEFVTLNKNLTLILDCQSFIHEFNVYKGKVSFENLWINYPILDFSCLDFGQYIINRVGDNKRICLIYNHKEEVLLYSLKTQFCFD